MAFVVSAIRRALRPLPASLGRPTCPRPWPSLNDCLAFARSKVPLSSTSVWGFFCQIHSICAAFSSRVIRESRSLTRFSAESAGLRYGRTPDLRTPRPFTPDDLVVLVTRFIVGTDDSPREIIGTCSERLNRGWPFQTADFEMRGLPEGMRNRHRFAAPTTEVCRNVAQAFNA